MSIYYEGTQIFGGRAKPPPQVWCPSCKRTIIDPVVEKVCVACDPTTKALQSEGK